MKPATNRLTTMLCTPATRVADETLAAVWLRFLSTFLRSCVFSMHPVAMLSVKSDRVSSATILVVDDEPEVRAVVAEFLEDFGYDVLLADSGPQALTVLRDNPSIGLLLTDIRMPEMSGIELADVVTARHPAMKVILMSGYFVAQQVNRRFLRKPFRMKELQAAVRAELQVCG